MAQTQLAPLQVLLDLCGRYMSAADLALVREAHAAADAAHAGTNRKSGEPYIEHPLAVASILAELAMDVEGIAAALLHDTVEDTQLTLDGVRTRFGPAIARVVDGVTKFGAAEATETLRASATLDGATPTLAQRKASKERQQAESVRKLLKAMSHDPRVVLVKLADRLHNLRTLDAMSDTQRERTARETLDIYAPLAGRMGLYNIKSELEDLAFRYLDPDAYAHTVQRLDDETAKRTHWAERMVERMQRELVASGIQAAVNWRVKHPYRAWIEARESGMDIALLHDLIAFRVLVNERDECYQALRVIHHLWHPYSERIRDYVSTPKLNGYQSLHTAVFALDGRLAQMHIRTHAMHRASQHGMATYWLERAEAGAQHAPAAPLWTDHKPRWVDRFASWDDDAKLSAAEFVTTLRGEVLEEQVFVFTPKGDVFELPAGATVIDFAYQIHTEIGDHTAGAQILSSDPDGLLEAQQVPPEYVLRTGDIVRVLRSPASQPSVEWLQAAQTLHARERIRRALRRGEEPAAAQRLEPAAESEPGLPGPLRHPSGRAATVRLGRCCYPCPGDKIAGLVESGTLVTVHRACCRTLHAALARRRARSAAHAEPLRVRWEDLQPIAYRLHLAIHGQDHRGLMHEVSACVAQLGLSVAGGLASANRARYKAAITITLDIPPTMWREQVMRRLRTVPGVLRVERDVRAGCDETAN